MAVNRRKSSEVNIMRNPIPMRGPAINYTPLPDTLPNTPKPPLAIGDGKKKREQESMTDKLGSTLQQFIPKKEEFKQDLENKRIKKDVINPDPEKKIPKPKERSDIKFENLPQDLKGLIFNRRYQMMKQAKIKRDIQKNIDAQNRAKYYAVDTEEGLPARRKLEETKKKVILSNKNINDPHMNYGKSVPTGRHVKKVLSKKTLDNFKLSAVGNETSFKKLVHSTLTSNEIINQQRRRQIMRENNHFDKKKKKGLLESKNNYKYKRIG
tara:strand:- start:676 stop:1476 length:801 start_codon:yes stop_codon:yes gene_type:complete